MRYRTLMSMLFSVLCCASAIAVEIPLHTGSIARFATVDEGATAITKRDHFLNSLSRFDLQSRLQTDREVTVDDLLKFTAKEVVAWEKDEVEKVTAAIQSIRARLEGFRPLFPKTVLLVKTTGKEEGNAAYCRGNAVVLPKVVLARKTDQLERLLIHELFHILSRHDAKRREKLYAIVGFKPCDEIRLPKSLAHRKITNPDAPTIDFYIELTQGDRQVKAAPVLYASVDKYDAQKGGTFFRYLQFRLLVVEQVDGNWRAVEKEGDAVVLNPKKAPDFFEQIGKNTNYIIHPDEILADNFVHLVKKTEKLQTPRIIDEMKKLLVK